MPMPDYRTFDLRSLAVGEAVFAAVADPWEATYPTVYREVVRARPWGRIVTDRSTYFSNGREARTWWHFWAYPKRLIAREGDL